MTDQPNQFAAVLPNFVQMAEAANYMQHHAQNMYANAAAMVQDMEQIADDLRAEEAELEREHAVRLARIRNHRAKVEGMIAHHLGVMRPEPPQAIERQPQGNVVNLPKRVKSAPVVQRKKKFGFF